MGPALALSCIFWGFLANFVLHDLQKIFPEILLMYLSICGVEQLQNPFNLQKCQIRMKAVRQLLFNPLCLNPFPYDPFNFDLFRIHSTKILYYRCCPAFNLV